MHDVLTNDGPAEKATALDYREMVEETPLYTLRKMILRQFLYVNLLCVGQSSRLTRWIRRSGFQLYLV